MTTAYRCSTTRMQLVILVSGCLLRQLLQLTHCGLENIWTARRRDDGRADKVVPAMVDFCCNPKGSVCIFLKGCHMILVQLRTNCEQCSRAMCCVCTVHAHYFIYPASHSCYSRSNLSSSVLKGNGSPVPPSTDWCVQFRLQHVGVQLLWVPADEVHERKWDTS